MSVCKTSAKFWRLKPKNMTQSIHDIRNQLLVARLPAMPQILLKLIELCDADEAGMAELAKLISNDAGMAAKVLGVANSAAYHRGGNKVGLLQALNVLGSELIKTLVISESVFQTFNGFPHASGIDLRGFWKHSLTVAVMAREVAKAIDYAQPEEAYLAGLLHDVGRLALLSAAPNEYVRNFLMQDTPDLCAVEQRFLQISHAEAGAWLIDRWNLDSFMSDSVLYHHEATERLLDSHPLIRIVHLAHLMGDHNADEPMAADAGAICQIDTADLEVMRQGGAAQVARAAAYLGVDISGATDLVAQLPPPPMPLPAAGDQAQGRLNDEVRNRSLMAELGQALARQAGDVQLLEAVRQNARVLFNLDDTVVFLTSSNGQALVGVSFAEQRQRLAEFAIKLSAGGALAEAAQHRRPVFVGPEKGSRSMVEEQLLRIFGSECLVCVPIASGGRCLGLLVAGVAAWRMPDIKRQEKWLQTFGTQVAMALNAASDRGEMDRRIAKLREEHKLSARKMVHEVNNPLTIIKNYLGVLDEKSSRQEPLSEEISILTEEIDRVGHLLNEFAGAAPQVQAGATNINDLVKHLVHLFRESNFLPASVQISAQLPDQAAEVDGSADAIKQILINLIKNSVEALPLGGQIVVQVNGVVVREGRSFRELCVIDTGPGMPAEVMAHVFSPVQSSKPGKNRGVGLSIVHGLVKKLDGWISCRSSKEGTVFEMLIPAKKQLASVAAPASARDIA